MISLTLFVKLSNMILKSRCLWEYSLLYINQLNGKLLSQTFFIEKRDRVLNWELKLTIIETWQDKLNDFTQLADVKKKLFNYSIFCLVVSVLLTIYNRFIGSVFS